MRSFEPVKKGKAGPEAKIQEAIIKELTIRGWFVKVTHGNMFQSGLPDLYATHSKYGPRWIEVKNPKAYSFTPAQVETIPKLSVNGSPVWVLIGSDESELKKLLGPENWYWYLKA